MKNIFFNSSMPRSGSTLLQNILAQNPEIHATPTDGSLELLYGARLNYTNSPEFSAQDQKLMRKAWLNFCKQGLLGYCDALTDRPNVCIKSRGIGIHYNWYSSFLDHDIKVLVMVRDMRSIFSSMEKMFRQQEEYNNEIQNHPNMTGTSTFKRVQQWSQSQPIGLAVERLNQMILEGKFQKCLAIREEDLTNNPKETMDQVYQYLELPSYKHDFNNVKQATKEDDEVYGLSKSLHKVRKKVTPNAPDYEKILGTHICNWINQNYAWYQQGFKYIEPPKPAQ